ncbi:hypothetical protein K0T92_01420 [Paenibacillus oenotherae]|uniref:Uncharacterized protein n=1 Tax=Paenibacillus oenotherae TaxID=1435645 RepID=A0ABS7D0L2_9BACL|nr:hypothetical protein [Paenibacillus oenotherae]MBW7473400.1 hypothetical protein [Paenibacillus oenotherae]
MKIRVLPAVLTAVLSAGLLVGGWYTYRNVATLGPLESIVADMPGVSSAAPVIGRDSVTMEITLDRDANVKDIYETIAREGESVIGGKELKFDIQEDGKQQELDKVWSTVLFDIAEAMENRHYTAIPAAMSRLEKQFSGIEASSEIDEVNVYITLKNGETAKHIVLPRTSEKLGVWPNA